MTTKLKLSTPPSVSRLSTITDMKLKLESGTTGRAVVTAAEAARAKKPQPENRPPAAAAAPVAVYRRRTTRQIESTATTVFNSNTRWIGDTCWWTNFNFRSKEKNCRRVESVPTAAAILFRIGWLRLRLPPLSQLIRRFHHRRRHWQQEQRPQAQLLECAVAVVPRVGATQRHRHRAQCLLRVAAAAAAPAGVPRMLLRAMTTHRRPSSRR